ncbi:TetR/AcrR family transcriptional regulator [Mycolicibacterium setense]|uniref:TetR/AcrR family transcriptional regulator n=1 Tax=Mycolicibacterium setense TaxID=431269 RepID=UPI00068D0643|nr:TetR/AcrR family transcriptional regulator [Mycolicibacterium setense]MCV7113696.1 TetR/AcrR family transcriptional regulator [Mycolicibacterium setense]
MVKRGWTRETLVALAHQYVSDHGIDALTMRRLATAADVSPSALYKHFRDRKDLQRAMADAVYATIDLSDIDTADSSVQQVKTCCRRMRAAMLAFRDGGRIIAGSYAPLEATLALSATLRTLLESVALPHYSSGHVAALLRSYTIGFVIDEQSFLELEASGEWVDLVGQITERGYHRRADADDLIAIVTGDRDQRFDTGLDMILTGLVRDSASR